MRRSIQLPQVKKVGLNVSEGFELRLQFISAIDQAFKEQTLIFTQIEASIYTLVIPPVFNYAQEESEQIAKEIQQSFLPQRDKNKKYNILNWSTVTRLCHLIRPSSLDWYSKHADRFNQGTQILFFVAFDDIKSIAEMAVRRAGFQIKKGFHERFLVASDGKFEDSIDLNALVSQSLWTAQEIAAVIEQEVVELKARFKLFRQLEKTLPKLFPQASFWRSQTQLHVLRGESHCDIHYQEIAKSVRFANMDLLTWLKRTALEDLCTIAEPAQLAVRSVTYLKARPEALYKSQQGHVLAVEGVTNGRAKSVSRNEDDPKERFLHFVDEAKRRQHEIRLSAHAFIDESSDALAMGLMGDQIASLAAQPALIKAAIMQTGYCPASVRLVSNHEDVLVIVNSNTPWEQIERLGNRAAKLFSMTTDDGLDPLHLDFHMQLPEHPSGILDLDWIPDAFFLLIESADGTQPALAGGRAAYLRGLAFEIIHLPTLALPYYRRAYRMDRSDGDINHALGRILTETRQTENAIPFLEKAIRLLPKDAEVANTLGLAYLECQHMGRAVQTLEQAVHLAPLDPQLLTNLGRCYFASSRFKEAEMVLQKALQYAPNFSTAHATLAQVRWRLGDLVDAKKHARRAFASDPANKSVQDLMWALHVSDDKK